VLIGPEGRTPPLPFITVDADEGRALIAQKLAAEVTGGDEAADAAEAAAREAAEREAAEAAEREAREAAEREAAEAAAREAAERAAAAGPNVSGDGEGKGLDLERASTIAEALDLVEADGLVKTGDRKGRPKVEAIEEITGLADVTAAEIDAAIAAKESAD
jgi:hypothetical protein